MSSLFGKVCCLRKDGRLFLIYQFGLTVLRKSRGQCFAWPVIFIYYLFLFLLGFCLFVWRLGELSEFHFPPPLPPPPRGFPPFKRCVLIQFPNRIHGGEDGGECSFWNQPAPCSALQQGNVHRRSNSSPRWPQPSLWTGRGPDSSHK